MPWLVSGVDVDFANFAFLFKAAEGVTHSLDLDDILIGCKVHEYRCRTVDANVNKVSPREVAQAAMVPTTLISRSLVRDVGKELPWVLAVLSVPFRASIP